MFHFSGDGEKLRNLPASAACAGDHALELRLGDGHQAHPVDRFGMRAAANAAHRDGAVSGGGSVHRIDWREAATSLGHVCSGESPDRVRSGRQTNVARPRTVFPTMRLRWASYRSIPLARCYQSVHTATPAQVAPAD